MGLRNGWFWASQIQRVFLPDIKTLARTLTMRLLPTFDNLHHEADQVSLDTWNSAAYPEETDPGDLADHALNEGLIHFQTMELIRQSVLNMFASGLWHAFEQTMLILHRQELLEFHEERNPELWNFHHIKQRLKAAGFDVETSKSWPSLSELQLLANTIKHGDGRSCDELKKRRPDLFAYSSEVKRVMDRELLAAMPIYKPMLGESVYVKPEDFDQFATAVQQFLNELTNWLEST